LKGKKPAGNAFLSKHHKKTEQIDAFVRILFANRDEKTCKMD
jgi:hypothetical protein